jgi:hypothetical protein
MTLKDDVEFALAMLFLFGLPLIGPALLWWFLGPSTFWQKLAWVGVSGILYVIGLGIILKIAEEANW